MWKTCILITINAIFTINFKCSFIPATLSLASITIFANENKITRAYTLSYSFYLILFGAFFCILSSAILINVYVYRKWKNEHRMMKISRRDLRVAQPVHRGRTSDYGDDDQDDVPSEKRQYSDDDRSRYSEDMSKHSEDFSTKQSEIWARPTVWHRRRCIASLQGSPCCERICRLNIDQYKYTVIWYISGPKIPQYYTGSIEKRICISV